jgi:hydroxyethylthiazole kinase
MQHYTPLGEQLSRIRTKKPLIHHITNMVVMNDTANITLAIGALPVMAHALEEVEEMTSIASSLVLNIGTLTSEQISSMLLAGKHANNSNIPIVLDPVGAGATQLRTESSLRLLSELKIAVLRGNAAEIGSLVGVASETRGVESISIAGDPQTIAQQAAKKFHCVVAITGARDYVTDGEIVASIDNGHPLLASITGSGCMSTSLIGAFLGVESHALQATTAALAAMGVAGENAAVHAKGPGTFRSHLLDAVAALDNDTLNQRSKVSFVS